MQTENSASPDEHEACGLLMPHPGASRHDILAPPKPVRSAREGATFKAPQARKMRPNSDDTVDLSFLRQASRWRMWSRRSAAS